MKAYKLLWHDYGTANLKSLPWNHLQDSGLKINIESFTDISAIHADSSSILFLLIDMTKEEEISKLKKVISKYDYATIFIFTSSNLKDQVMKLISNNKTHHIIAKPIKSSEFLLLLEKFLLVEHYRQIENEHEHSETEWLSKMEEVFEFSRKELLNKESEIMAYEKLVQYEQHLLVEQKKINQALLALQDFRDVERKEWDQERSAYEKLENLHTNELIDKDQTVRAQETLIEFARKQKLEYFKLLSEFEKKGTLMSEDLKKLFSEHKSLMTKIQSMEE